MSYLATIRCCREYLIPGITRFAAVGGQKNLHLIPGLGRRAALKVIFNSWNGTPISWNGCHSVTYARQARTSPSPVSGPLRRGLPQLLDISFYLAEQALVWDSRKKWSGTQWLVPNLAGLR